MSMLRIVADLVRERGSLDLDEAMTILGDEFTRTKVKGGFHNAQAIGLIHTRGPASRAGIKHAGSVAARYYPGRRGELPQEPEQDKTRVVPKLASVWDLAQVQERVWPPVGEGRKFNLLGPWDAA